MEVNFLFSSNIFLNCRCGPDKNTDDIRDNMLPDVYKNTNGAGFPSTSLMNSRNDINVIR